MKVRIEESKAIDVASVIRRSPHASIEGAEKKLRSFINRSIYTWAGTVGGETACVFGLIAPTMLAEEAYLWLIVTDLVKDHEFLFIRYSQRFVEQVLGDFTTIVGDVEVTNDRAKRWLRWLGAKIYSDNAREGFAPFIIKAKHG
jgi:hypothetical protein